MLSCMLDQQRSGRNNCTIARVFVQPKLMLSDAQETATNYARKQFNYSI